MSREWLNRLERREAMKRIRLVSLLLTLGVLTANPQLLRADPGACCSEFWNFCYGFCYEHGGALLADCHVGMGCLEVCFCSDGEQYAEGPHFCDPCE
jgi:hypothetical protein